MKRLILIATAAFWLAMGAIWLMGWLGGARVLQDRSTTTDAASGDLLTWDQVAGHGTEASCWLVIEGGVYDVTSYIRQHPADPRTILRYCGKDATRGFATKDRGRPHSEYARRLLESYRIGSVPPN